jgi:hypothetical protein
MGLAPVLYPVNRRVSSTVPVVAFLLSAVSFSADALAQQWTEYVSREDRFVTQFPGVPEVREITWDSEYGAVFPGRVHALDVDERHFSVTVIDYSDAKAIHEARTNSTEADDPASYQYWRIDKLASMAYAATQFRRRGGEVTYDAWHHIDRVPGHQLQITNPDGSRTFAGIYLHQDHLFIIEATVPRGTPPQGMFQQGLRFIDEEGRTIRYQYDENDHLVRQIR